MKFVRIVCISVLFAMSVLFVSCHKKEIPSYVIPEQKMAEILKDAYLLEGFYAIETHFHYDTLDAEMLTSVDSLFSKYQISQHDFDTSIAWYVLHPDVYKRIHDTVIARLDREMFGPITMSPESDQNSEPDDAKVIEDQNVIEF